MDFSRLPKRLASDPLTVADRPVPVARFVKIEWRIAADSFARNNLRFMRGYELHGELNINTQRCILCTVDHALIRGMAYP